MDVVDEEDEDEEGDSVLWKECWLVAEVKVELLVDVLMVEDLCFYIIKYPIIIIIIKLLQPII